MGHFLFSWEHPASEVYVTGTFDDWKKTEKLEKKGDVFEKLVKLPFADKKIDYKFVVDGNWVTNHTAPQETDSDGNVNNFLLPADILKESDAPHPAAISSVAPESTTAKLAAEVPLEKDKEVSVNPIPASEGLGNPKEEETFSVNPIPASEGLGNPKPAPEKSADTVSVNPIPASNSLGNPIKLAPGEPVPDSKTISGNDITSHVKLDKESYDKGPSGPPGADDIAAAVDVPPLTKNLIPESSLPVGVVPTIQSSGADSTTAQLAGQVPLENQKLPEIVKDSQNEAGVSAEASALPAAVEKKAAVEAELTSTVPETVATHESHHDLGTAGEYAASAVAAIGGAALGAAAYLSKTTEPYTHSAQEKAAPYLEKVNKAAEPYVKKVEAATAPYVKQVEERTAPFTAAVQEKMAAAHPSTAPVPAEQVPQEVKTSIAKSGEAPEAAASPVAVEEKAAVESELLSKVKPEEGTGESAPKIADSTKAKVSEAAETTKAKASETAEKASASASKAADKAEAKVDAATSSTGESSTTTDKKSKRKSFIFKLKHKLHLDK